MNKLFESRDYVSPTFVHPVPSGARHIADVPLMFAELSSPRAETSNSPIAALNGICKGIGKLSRSPSLNGCFQRNFL